MQVSDQGADAIRRPVLGLLDLEEQLLGLIDLAGVEMSPRDVHLDRQPEQELCEIVVEELRDLETLVSPFLRHAVRKRSQHLFSVLEFLVGLLERFATEEHLPGEKKREYEDGDNPPLIPRIREELCEHESEDCKGEIADNELTQTSNPQLANDPNWIGAVMQACNNRDDPEVHDVVHDCCQERGCDQGDRRGVEVDKDMEDPAGRPNGKRDRRAIEQRLKKAYFTLEFPRV